MTTNIEKYCFEFPDYIKDLKVKGIIEQPKEDRDGWTYTFSEENVEYRVSLICCMRVADKCFYYHVDYNRYWV